MQKVAMILGSLNSWFYDYDHLYFFSLLIVALVLLGVIFLREKRIISFKTARWTIVCSFALTAIPGSKMVGVVFSFGLTLAYCLWFYWLFWAYERISKQKQQREGNKDNVCSDTDETKKYIEKV